MNVESIEDAEKILKSIYYGTEGGMENWKSRSPEEIMKSKLGVCWDTAELQDYLLNKLGIEHKNIITASDRAFRGENGTDETHTFVVHKTPEDKWKWIEPSWQDYKDNTLEKDTAEELIKEIVNLQSKRNKLPYSYRELSKFPGEGKNVERYYKELLGLDKKAFIESVYYQPKIM